MGLGFRVWGLEIGAFFLIGFGGLMVLIYGIGLRVWASAWVGRTRGPPQHSANKHNCLTCCEGRTWTLKNLLFFRVLSYDFLI